MKLNYLVHATTSPVRPFQSHTKFIRVKVLLCFLHNSFPSQSVVLTPEWFKKYNDWLKKSTKQNKNLIKLAQQVVCVFSIIRGSGSDECIQNYFDYSYSFVKLNLVWTFLSPWELTEKFAWFGFTSSCRLR